MVLINHSRYLERKTGLERERERERWQEIGSKGHERMAHLREEDVDDASVGVN